MRAPFSGAGGGAAGGGSAAPPRRHIESAFCVSIVFKLLTPI